MLQINQMSRDEFVAAFGSIFEHTPAIAERVWCDRPFADVADLHSKMAAVVWQLSQTEKLALIQSHPDLGSKTKMAEASVREQTGAGLDRLSVKDYIRFSSLNTAYRQKFGFPFIIAVKNLSVASILSAFEERINNSPEAEMEQAVTEIIQIAKFRLNEAIVPLSV
jgi:2-oxo-4-hydroxy-4-carboxy-5-ureidoimidazoline decarboxylase